jgi:hypothetical protein
MRPVLPVVAILLATSCSRTSTAAAGTAAAGDFCHSEEFRSAFLEGQEGIIIDYTSPGGRLLAYGDSVLSCLIQINEDGGDALSLDRCPGSTDGCRGWAHAAIRLIGTAKARHYLLQRLEQEQEPVWISKTAVALGSLREEGARPRLRELLKHDDPQVRVASLTALGAIGRRDDFEAMGSAVLDLPDEYVPKALHGFRILGDQKALSLLERRLETLRDELSRERTERALASWRSAIAADRRLVTTLRTGSGWEVITALRSVQRWASPEIRAAVLELLEHEDPLIRAESVIAVGKMHVVSDFDRLLAVTLALPEPYVAGASRGLVFLNDARAIAPLEAYAAQMKNSQRQRELLERVEQIRRGTAGSAGN